MIKYYANFQSFSLPSLRRIVNDQKEIFGRRDFDLFTYEWIIDDDWKNHAYEQPITMIEYLSRRPVNDYIKQLLKYEKDIFYRDILGEAE